MPYKNENQETNQSNHTEPVEIPLITHKYEESKKPSHQVTLDKKQSFMKPIILASSAAILIGGILGFIMLNLFTNIGGNLKYADKDPTSVHADPVEKITEDKSEIILKEMGAFVLQGGVFSEKVNADEWANTYQQAGFPTVIFKRDQQYFLLVGLADTEERAKKLATALEKDQFDVYVKRWTTKEKRITLTAEENHWLLSFQEQWKNTLQSISKQEGVLLEGWSDLTNSYPLQSPEILQLVEMIHAFHQDDLAQKSDFELQNMLLYIWGQYEDII